MNCLILWVFIEVPSDEVEENVPPTVTEGTGSATSSPTFTVVEFRPENTYLGPELDYYEELLELEEGDFVFVYHAIHWDSMLQEFS